MTEQIKICPYCQNEIRPLDNHTITSEIDKDKNYIIVKCLLIRYYKVEIKDRNV